VLTYVPELRGEILVYPVEPKKIVRLECDRWMIELTPDMAMSIGRLMMAYAAGFSDEV
jgi:hypothetical protein